MASLAGAIAGGAIGGSIGGPPGAIIGSIIGSLAGGLFDNYVILPAITDEPRLAPPELADVAPSTGDDARPMPWLIGTEGRVPGVVIWRETTPRQVGENPGGPGKGSTEAVTSNERWVVNLAVAWGTTNGEAIDSIDEIRADGEAIFKRSTTFNVFSDQYSVTRYETYRWDEDTDQQVLDRVYMIVESTAQGPDLSELQSGYDVTCSSFSNAGNNGQFLCARADADTLTGKTFLWLLNANCVDEAAGANAGIGQTGVDQSVNYYDEVTHYLGDPDQDPDSLIEDEEGVGNVPGFQGIVYSVFENFNLNAFGLRIPQFVATTNVTASKSRADAIAQLLTAGGYDTDEYDVSGVSGQHEGISPPGPVAVQDLLAPMLMAYDIVAYEANGKLVFVDRANAEEIAIDPELLAARRAGTPAQQVQEPFQINRVEPGRLPTEVIVKYREPFQNLQPGSQRQKYQGAARPVVQSLDFPIAMSGQTAANIAGRLLWSQRANGAASYVLLLPPSQIGVHESSIVTFSYGGESYRMFVGKVDYAFDRRLELECSNEVLDLSTIGDFPAEAVPLPNPDFYVPPHIRIEPLDIPPLTASEANRQALYWATNLLDSNELHIRADPGVGPNIEPLPLDTLGRLRARSVIGNVVGTMPDSSGIDDAVWDDVTTFDVQVYGQSTLASASSDLDVLNGSNWAAVGQEIIGFRFAVDQGGGVYRISRLLRARRGTHRYMVRHAQNERFVLLDEARLQVKNHLSRSLGWAGAPLAYYAFPFFVRLNSTYGDLYKVERYVQPYKNITQRPFPPVGLYARRFGSTNYYYIFWHHATRVPSPIFPGPISTSRGKFRLRLWSGNPDAGGTELYAQDINDTAGQGQYSFLVSAQLHSLAGLAAGAPHWVTVSEIDAPFGEGLRSQPLFVDF